MLRAFPIALRAFSPSLLPYVSPLPNYSPREYSSSAQVLRLFVLCLPSFLSTFSFSSDSRTNKALYRCKDLLLPQLCLSAIVLSCFQGGTIGPFSDMRQFLDGRDPLTTLYLPACCWLLYFPPRSLATCWTPFSFMQNQSFFFSDPKLFCSAHYYLCPAELALLPYAQMRFVSPLSGSERIFSLRVVCASSLNVTLFDCQMVLFFIP